MKGRQAWHDLSAYVPFENFLLLFRPWRLRFRVPSCSKDKIARVGVRGDKSFPGLIPSSPMESPRPSPRKVCLFTKERDTLSFSLELTRDILILLEKYNCSIYDSVESRVSNDRFKRWIHVFARLRDNFGYRIPDRSKKRKGWGETKRMENSFVIRFINAICAKLDRERFARSIPKLDRMCISRKSGRGGEAKSLLNRHGSWIFY